MIALPSRGKGFRWKSPAAANFYFGGTSSALFLLYWLDSLGLADGQQVGGTFVGILCAALVFAGFLPVAFEAGRPARARYLLSSLSTAWMSREVLLGSAFALLCVLYGAYGFAFLGRLAALCAVFFALSQAMIVYRSMSVPAWNTWLAPAFILSLNSCAGYGAALVVGLTSTRVIVFGLCCLVIHSTISLSYQVFISMPRVGHKQPIKRTLRRESTTTWLPGLLSLYLLYHESDQAGIMTTLCGLVIGLGAGVKMYAMICQPGAARDMTLEASTMEPPS